MKAMLALIVAYSLLAPSDSLCVASQIQVSTYTELSLVREYGWSLWDQCRLNVTMRPRQPAEASLVCGSTPPRAPSLSATEQLSAEEERRLIVAVEDPSVWVGQAVGTDTRRGDGTFERIEVQQGNTRGIVVTSGNRSFENDPPRRELLGVLKAIENRLYRKGESQIMGPSPR